MLPTAYSFTLPFLRKEQIAKDVYSFYFDRVAGRGSDFNFLPGQYIRLTLPHDNPDERGTSRFFTISSSPLNTEHVILTTKLPQSTFKRTLSGLKVGYEASFFGPMGKFVLDEKDSQGRVFIAGGIGITPFHSMVRYADVKKLSLPITLFAFFSTKEDIIFYDELMKINKRNKHIQVIYSLTKPHKWNEWLEKHLGDWKKQKYYIVGAPGMVTQTRELLEKTGLTSEQIITEDFTGY